MKTIKVMLTGLILAITLTTFAFAQGSNSNRYPSLTFGVNGGLLGIGTDNFDIIYGTSNVWMYGLEGSLKLFKIGNSGRLYSVFQLYYFEKNGKTIGAFSEKCLWQHRIFNIGGRYSLSSTASTRAWFGAGAALVEVTETIGNSLQEINESTTGFYLEFGGAYKLTTGIELTGNIKIDGASIPNHGGIGGVGNQQVNVSTVTMVAGINLAI